jgi:hypothetical protein
MATGDQALLAALFLPQKRLGEVCCPDISCTPIPALQRGLLSKTEVGHASTSTLFAPADSQTVKTLSKTVEELWPPLLRLPCMS